MHVLKTRAHAWDKDKYWQEADGKEEGIVSFYEAGLDLVVGHRVNRRGWRGQDRDFGLHAGQSEEQIYNLNSTSRVKTTQKPTAQTRNQMKNHKWLHSSLSSALISKLSITLLKMANIPEKSRGNNDVLVMFRSCRIHWNGCCTSQS